jgi:hypothetical protein
VGACQARAEGPSTRRSGVGLLPRRVAVLQVGARPEAGSVGSYFGRPGDSDPVGDGVCLALPQIKDCSGPCSTWSECFGAEVERLSGEVDSLHAELETERRPKPSAVRSELEAGFARYAAQNVQSAQIAQSDSIAQIARQLARPQEVVQTELSLELTEWSPFASPRKFHLLVATNTGTGTAENVRLSLLSVTPPQEGTEANVLPAYLPDDRGQTEARSIKGGDKERFYVLQSWMEGDGFMVKGLDGDPGVGEASHRPPVRLVNGEQRVLHVRLSAQNAAVINATIQVDCQADALWAIYGASSPRISPAVQTRSVSPADIAGVTFCLPLSAMLGRQKLIHMTCSATACR